jgi:energy-coupling factor transport system ATP-binding protein
MIDDDNKDKILEILEDLHKKGITIINVTHNLKEAYYSDRLVILNDGEILLDGNPMSVMEYDKILNKVGIEIPFEVELSIKLKLYGLIDKVYFNLDKMVDDIWQ